VSTKPQPTLKTKIFPLLSLPLSPFHFSFSSLNITFLSYFMWKFSVPNMFGEMLNIKVLDS
jgi:hypothetical protein